MSKTQVTVEEVVEQEPSLEEVEKQAAKQLLIELKMVKQSIYESKTIMNSMLVVQLKQILRGLIHKYNEFGLLKGENVTLKLSNYGKIPNIQFIYTPKLESMFAEIVNELPKPGVEPIEPKEQDVK